MNEEIQISLREASEKVAKQKQEKEIKITQHTKAMIEEIRALYGEGKHNTDQNKLAKRGTRKIIRKDLESYYKQKIKHLIKVITSVQYSK